MNETAELIPTRQSLLSRLKDWNDQDSWKVFFDTYWKLIYTTGVKAGLSDAEAQDMVQETVIAVMKKMPGFEYDARKGSFKGWLLQLTKWKITDQFRKRRRENENTQPEAGPSSRTDELECVADPGGVQLEQVWDDEWETNLLDAAIDRVKRKVDAKLYQIFDLYVFKKWSVSKIAKSLKVNAGRVYLAKHRISRMIKKEMEYLRTKPI